jgi:superfamily I DNA and/or RNA helicase
VRYRSPRPFASRNPVEARLAARLVDALAGCLARDGAPVDAQTFAADGLAVLAPHRAQNSAIRSALVEAGFDPPGCGGVRPLPTVDTVDKLQGQERDAVVVSYGVADEAYAAAEGEFLFSRRRFNVAATRARRKLIVLVADQLLEATPPSREVLEEASMLTAFADYCSSGSETHTWDDPDFGAVDLHVSWRGFD